MYRWPVRPIKKRLTHIFDILIRYSFDASTAVAFMMVWLPILTLMTTGNR